MKDAKMKPVKAIYKNMDMGRVIAVTLFALLVWLNLVGFNKKINFLLPLNLVKSLELIHHLLIIGFYALVILLYFLRSSARMTIKSFGTKTIAILTTCLPFTLPILNSSTLKDPGILFTANFIMILGMLFAIYALFVLGKNFSIIPQARSLVRKGPYKLIRHPLYTAEIISAFGIFLVRPSVLTTTVFLLIILGQVYRAFQEEILLNSIFPEYEHYRLKTARFIPYIF